VSATFPVYSVQQSFDLHTWQAVGGPVQGSVGVSDQALRLAVPLTGEHAFYRVVASVQPAGDGRFGDTIFGYGTQFSRELQRVGQLSLGDFVVQYGLTNQYLSAIQFDPTTAQFWNEFNIDPAVYNATNSTDPRGTDFRLTSNEFAVFQTNGFVVLPRLGSYSFADAFYKVYSDELPVFVSADAILQAWHRTYTAMLEEIEETFLAPNLQGMLQSLSAQVPRLWTEAQGTAVEQGVLDADLFLAVAQSLITGNSNYGQLGQQQQIASLLTAIATLQPGQITLFGSDRVIDFSQFQVRGHYTTSQRLSRYFKAMMWCGLVDFRIAGATNANSLRELSGAVALNQAMSRSAGFQNWQQFDAIVQMFVGAPDSMNFAQLGDLLSASGLTWPADYTSNGLQTLQDRLMSGQLGVQNIRSGYFWSPLTREQIKLPRSFTFMGQRFTVDGWAQNKVVFDDIIWDEDGIPGFEDKVMRRVPSALDVAFSVLANSQVVPEIAERISRTNLTLAAGRPFFRDGLKYQHNLAALRNVIDNQAPEAWTNNIYSSWLGCLRELSRPTTDSRYPQAMRTHAWAMKELNTQLAS
ncbi:MAG TPA: DUF3160 domain-containing protein, partial [Verrucomicrobiae bacterium]|nr:DUF3160 domain-containing protein [Verrucomicrobiae bacterium]